MGHGASLDAGDEGTADSEMALEEHLLRAAQRRASAQGQLLLGFAPSAGHLELSWSWMLRLRGLALDSWLVVALTEPVFRSLRTPSGVPCVLAPGHADAHAPVGAAAAAAASGGAGGAAGGGEEESERAVESVATAAAAAHGLRLAGLREWPPARPRSAQRRPRCCSTAGRAG